MDPNWYIGQSNSTVFLIPKEMEINTTKLNRVIGRYKNYKWY